MAGIQDGDIVYVQSVHGEMEMEASLTEYIITECVSLVQGSWAIRDAKSVEKGKAANILASMVPTLPRRGSPTDSIFVKVRMPSRVSA